MARLKIDPDDLSIAQEFRRQPIGYHSKNLQAVLNLFRGGPVEGKWVLVCRKPWREWVLAQLPGKRGAPLILHEDVVFTDWNAAEWEVFRRRWREHTGRELTLSRDDAPPARR
jgi:hypothetical protein